MLFGLRYVHPAEIEIEDDAAFRDARTMKRIVIDSGNTRRVFTITLEWVRATDPRVEVLRATLFRHRRTAPIEVSMPLSVLPGYGGSTGMYGETAVGSGDVVTAAVTDAGSTQVQAQLTPQGQARAMEAGSGLVIPAGSLVRFRGGLRGSGRLHTVDHEVRLDGAAMAVVGIFPALRLDAGDAWLEFRTMRAFLADEAALRIVTTETGMVPHTIRVIEAFV